MLNKSLLEKNIPVGAVVVDVRGTLCPTPVIETKKVVDKNKESIVVTIVDNVVSRDNVRKFAVSQGYAVEVIEETLAHADLVDAIDKADEIKKMADYYVILSPEHSVQETAKTLAATAARALENVLGAATTGMNEAMNKINDIADDSADSVAKGNKLGGKTILITKDYLGEGSEELGRTLMKTFLSVLPEVEEKPAKIFLINSAVKLVTGEGQNMESLKQLADLGVEIAACGICLNFFDLTEAVKVGSITNMYVITEALLSDKVVTL